MQIAKIFKSPWWFGSRAVIYAAIEAASWIGLPPLQDEHSRVVWLLSVQTIFIVVAVGLFAALYFEKEELKNILQSSGPEIIVTFHKGSNSVPDDCFEVHHTGGGSIRNIQLGEMTDGSW